MEFEEIMKNVIEKMGNESRAMYFYTKYRGEAFIKSILEQDTQSALDNFMVSGIRFNLLDSDVSNTVHYGKLPDEVLDKMTAIYDKARIEIEKVLEDLEDKE